MRFSRLRRLRERGAVRDWVSQADLSAKDLILPYFVMDGVSKKESIESMPAVYRLSVDNLLKDMEEARSLGIRAVLLFGVSHKKDASGRPAYAKTGVVQKAVAAIRKRIGDAVVITDVCLCGYTSHGHCGIVKKSKIPGLPSKSTARAGKSQDYRIDNDATIKVLAKVALSHAEAGADFVAPSAMMDGQVLAIREALDKDDFEDVGIVAYSAKYASNFYGPFRDALDSAPKFGDRRSYQMDFKNSDEALREIGQDIKEGADIIMVKPALAYLDVIWRARERFNVPIAAYNVSGEYAMVKVYCDEASAEKNLVLEILTAIKRAGANFIISYHAKEVARWLKKF